MRSSGINGEGELRGQPANPGLLGKMAVKTECVRVCITLVKLWCSVAHPASHSPIRSANET